MNSTTRLKDIVQKVVQFKYLGGTKPGATRTVRVEKVTRHDNVVYVEGLDLGVADLKEAYRRYVLNKIDGDIVVVG